VPFGYLEEEFESSHPNVDVLLEAYGSRAAICQITELGKQADILASADYTLIPDMMYDEYADWYIAFATNAMVLCYRDSSARANEIAKNPDEFGVKTPWYEILQMDDVTYGHSNPDMDPCGYRTLMVIQLAEARYPDADGLYDALIPGRDLERGRVSQGREVVARKSVDLIAYLQSGDLDYAFEYRSVAVQSGLNFIELDDHINLSNPEHADFYETATVTLSGGKEKHGKPIVYGITIPQNARNPELAWEFIMLLLSEDGQHIMTDVCGQPSISPAWCDAPENLPVWIKEEEIV
jgi:molybdate/tungstate transport system substrate-binding protein